MHHVHMYLASQHAYAQRALKSALRYLFAVFKTLKRPTVYCQGQCSSNPASNPTNKAGLGPDSEDNCFSKHQ